MATVDAIVEASIQLLVAEGYDRFTTARAAERAGVSVGSLYQYFPNKAALASAVVDRCCASFIITLESAMADRRRNTLEECVRGIVEVTLVSHRLAPELHRIVIELAPRIGVEAKTEAVNRRVAAAIEAVLRKHVDEIAEDIDLAVAATIIDTLLQALARRVRFAEPSLVEDGVLAGETTRLITRYLAAAPSWPGTSGTESAI